MPNDAFSTADSRVSTTSDSITLTHSLSRSLSLSLFHHNPPRSIVVDLSNMDPLRRARCWRGLVLLLLMVPGPSRLHASPRDVTETTTSASPSPLSSPRPREDRLRAIASVLREAGALETSAESRWTRLFRDRSVEALETFVNRTLTERAENVLELWTNRSIRRNLRLATVPFSNVSRADEDFGLAPFPALETEVSDDAWEGTGGEEDGFFEENVDDEGGETAMEALPERTVELLRALRERVRERRRRRRDRRDAAAARARETVETERRVEAKERVDRAKVEETRMVRAAARIREDKEDLERRRKEVEAKRREERELEARLERKEKESEALARSAEAVSNEEDSF